MDNLFYLIKSGASQAKIVYESDPVYEFAAGELKGYIEKITGVLIDGASPVYIGSPEWVEEKTGKKYAIKNDGYAIDAQKDCLVLTGGQKRGALYAVYNLLYSFGVRWYFPGPGGEFLPEKTDELATGISEVSSPDMVLRNYTYDGPHDGSDENPGVWVAEMGQAIDWFAKTGINSVYFCDPPYSGIPGLSAVMRECGRRGLMVELGGHGVQDLVDRSLFDAKPELFREKDGKRDISGNFCGSNPEAVKMVCDGVLKLFEDYPGLDISVLHLWFEDVDGGSWCSCEKCKDKTPPEQLLNVINAVAKTIQKKQPGVMLDAILYHDTLRMSEAAFGPEGNIYGFFCPRERCRAHSIGDKSCKKNSGQYGALLQNAAYFSGEKMYIFEYYADFILYVNLGICTPSVIIQDIKDYSAAGSDKICNLMFGKYSWWAYQTNMYAYSRACWDNGYDRNSEHEEFLRVVYGRYAGRMREYYELFERASMKMLPFCEYGDNISDLRNIPPQCPEFYREHAKNIGEAAELYEKAYELTAALCAECKGEPEFAYVEREMYLMLTSKKDARALWHQMTGRILGYLGDVEARREHLDMAIAMRKEGAETMRRVPEKYNGRCGKDSLGFYASMAEWYEAMKQWG